MAAVVMCRRVPVRWGPTCPNRIESMGGLNNCAASMRDMISLLDTHEAPIDTRSHKGKQHPNQAGIDIPICQAWIDDMLRAFADNVEAMH
jgi:hypothetical protein